MANYSQELAQDAVCQSHTGHMTGLWFLPAQPLRLNTNEWMTPTDHKCICLRANINTRLSITTPSRHTEGGNIFRYTPLILGSRWGASDVLTPRPLYPRNRYPIRTHKNAVWTPEPAWKFREEKYFSPTGIRTPDLSARSLITIPTDLTCLCCFNCETGPINGVFNIGVS